ncbi:TetR/AcrR family transcriptional regulator [Lysinibacillus sp. fkY74-1]|uniref:Transcriptional regulator n=3 Tax=Lysinibacillus TaxID=400634 RepID=B1HYB5_LYSSC|nr:MULTISPECIES: TetR/AcrR family transcriptional regulator [Lysinibacillus]MBE5082587.1 TetR/AcrR family transcriptional regulator [Bacillus thuringiensis]ACA38376.1 transcriptional regulator [Lysinibacillus sphaericus C3-41]AMO31324.1 transcriptional regulator [Lysinibacillus sphaericus]AMR89566.1 transcriptional regulator [Lysinibacillus sphaericus]ANA47637.1 transcriptional regulator [Lysinibacillus sphaericus]
MNKRKRQIITAARALFIEKGFLDTSINDIIHDAKISKGTFYNHFSSKNECLIAILDEGREEASNRRHELIYGKDPTDLEVLTQQVAVLMYVNREHNLIQIFESIFHSRDKELKKIIINYHLQELEWLANRLVQVFGEEISPISYECAVQTLGMINLTLRAVFIADYDKYINREAIVRVALRNISVIIPTMLESKEIIVSVEMINTIQNVVNYKTVTKDMVIEQLRGFAKGLTNNETVEGLEYAEFLLEELQRENPKLFIIESLLTPFRKAFVGTEHVAEARDIANSLWRYVKIERPAERCNKNRQ